MTNRSGSDPQASHDGEGGRRTAPLDRMVESSLFKLLVPTLGAILMGMVTMTNTRFDRFETTLTSIQSTVNGFQTAQALNAQDVETLKRDKIARDSELSDLNRRLADVIARLAVLEAQTVRR